MGNGFEIDVEQIRQRARQNLEDGSVTSAYRADRAVVVRLLNEAVATELVCMLRYRRHYFMAVGVASEAVAVEFLEHSREELEHADQLAQRIVQLDGEPDLDPDGLAARAHSEYEPGTTLIEMIEEDLVNERIAIQAYAEMIRYVGDDDPTTRRLLESILEKEEEHAEEMASLLPHGNGG